MTMTPFCFKGADVRVITDEAGDPWFVAMDVALTLGYSNTSDAVARHCKAVQILKSQNATFEVPNRGLQIIPERDLYRLIMNSQLDSAQEFEEWVVAEVLPTIRKTGSYSRPIIPQSLPDALRLAADLAEENGKLALANEHQAQTIASLESLFMTGETPTQFCKRLRGVNVSKVNRSLLVLGWLFDSAADDRSKPRYRVASRVRDRYLTERPRKISTEGADSFVRYDLILLLRGAKRLHELYMTGQLIMKASWDGIFTHAKYSGGDRDE